MTEIKRYEWDANKNELLKRERNISFEKVIFHLAEGDLWKIARHPNQEKYPNQSIYFVVIENYVYLVPYETIEEEIILKTIIPSRKATKDYLEEKHKKGGL